MHIGNKFWLQLNGNCFQDLTDKLASISCDLERSKEELCKMEALCFEKSHEIQTVQIESETCKT